MTGHSMTCEKVAYWSHGVNEISECRLRISDFECAACLIIKSAIFTQWNPPKEGRLRRHSTGRVENPQLIYAITPVYLGNLKFPDGACERGFILLLYYPLNHLRNNTFKDICSSNDASFGPSAGLSAGHHCTGSKAKDRFDSSAGRSLSSIKTSNRSPKLLK